MSLEATAGWSFSAAPRPRTDRGLLWQLVADLWARASARSVRRTPSPTPSTCARICGGSGTGMLSNGRRYVIDLCMDGSMSVRDSSSSTFPRNSSFLRCRSSPDASMSKKSVTLVCGSSSTIGTFFLRISTAEARSSHEVVFSTLPLELRTTRISVLSVAMAVPRRHPSLPRLDTPTIVGWTAKCAVPTRFGTWERGRGPSRVCSCMCMCLCGRERERRKLGHPWVRPSAPLSWFWGRVATGMVRCDTIPPFSQPIFHHDPDGSIQESPPHLNHPFPPRKKGKKGRRQRGCPTG